MSQHCCLIMKTGISVLCRVVSMQPIPDLGVVSGSTTYLVARYVILLFTLPALVLYLVPCLQPQPVNLLQDVQWYQ